MLKTRSLPLFLLFFAVMISGCGDSSPTGPDPFGARAIPEHMLPFVEEAVTAGNLFAFDLYAELKDGEGNRFFSPYSISSALSMTYAGAAGITEEEMARVLHVPNNPSQWHPAVGALQNSLNRGIALGGYELSIANRLWAQEGYPFLESFFAIMQDCYDAGVALINFALDPEAARLIINEWVADQTQDKIQDLISPPLSGDTRLVLVNAIYFKGTWLTQFDPELTTDRSFRITADESVTVPMMMLKETEFNYVQTDDVSILEMPYDGEDLSMIVLLPEEVDALTELEDALTLARVESWLASMYKTTLNVILPKFEMTSEFLLNEVLARMGMPSAFGNADFSNMTGARDLFISAVIHKAFVNVNEEGTEAAAATAVIMLETCMGNSFVANHPFIFLIRDNVTGSILFMGRVSDPSA